ncbi:MAG: bifunctional 5,10-methylene-tetrahydrofolate dehydrogenase/5,10-methylene-tetrahydrofolate cyclohydrolase [Erysipelotrichaceae bacterium]|nr:bifunctional 5,10-methylene-tetrahydrofolate dehydrogenase/5,10-methylene-tetrahydrofolate cyclohydrolase [Erysipelotrichaceae bacterium]
MAELLKGKEVAASISERSTTEALALKEKGITPTLAVFRLGEKDEDLSYERGIDKRSADTGVEVRKYVFPEDVEEEVFYKALDEANNDPAVHGILIFRPLPKRFDDRKLRNYIAPEKDVDGCSDLSLAGVFTNTELGFAPCTAKAAIEILDHYGIDVKGKNVTVLGRSLVIGKPVAMLLLNRNATVTICHTKTKDIKSIASKADILICATGVMESVNKDYVNPEQVIIDVGISWNDEKGKLCGDVLFEEVEPFVKKITPVPGGVGSVTTSVLISNVVEAAKRKNR